MYRILEDFITDWLQEDIFTEKIFLAVREGSQREKVHPNVRTLERLAWHITQTITEMGEKAGLFEHDPLEDRPAPATMKEIAEAYLLNSKKLAELIREKWTDASLEEEVNMYGESWKKGKILSVLVAHGAHHRSQMTVVMRLLGMAVPGIYGPSKEEWAAIGMPAME